MTRLSAVPRAVFRQLSAGEQTLWTSKLGGVGPPDFGDSESGNRSGPEFDGAYPMAFFLATMTHPDGAGWRRHVLTHVQYFQRLIEAGKVRASGPVTGLGKRAGFIMMTVDTRDEVELLVAADPFSTEGLIDELTILEWDPMFGALAEDASRPKVRQAD